jgi:hypothetical protein
MGRTEGPTAVVIRSASSSRIAAGAGNAIGGQLKPSVCERQERVRVVGQLLVGGEIVDRARQLTLDQQGVVDADGLGHGQLDTGKKVLQHRLQGKAEHQARGACRCQEADAPLLHALEGHERSGRAHDDEHGHRHALENAGLRHVLARQEIVLGLEGEPAQVQGHPNVHRRAGGQHGEDDDADDESVLDSPRRLP